MRAWALTNRFLAFDLGAESGRAILGSSSAGALTITEVCRFPTSRSATTVAAVGRPPALARDAARPRRLPGTRSTASASTPGAATTRSSASAATCSRTRSLPRRAHRRGDGGGLRPRSARTQIYDATGIQFLPFNTLYQLYAACRATPRLIDAATRARHDSRSAELLADRPAARRIHQRDDHAVRRCADASWATGSARRRSTCRRGCCRRSSSRARSSAGCAGRVRRAAPARRSSRRPATTRAPRSRRSQAAAPRVPQLRHLVAARHRARRRRSSRRGRAS